MSFNIKSNIHLITICIISFSIQCKKIVPVNSTNNNDSTEILISSFPFYKGSAPRIFDLLHTKLELKFDWNKRQVLGKVLLILKPYYYSQNYLILDAQSFDVEEIEISINQGKFYPVKFENDEKQLIINLESVITRNDQLQVKFNYIASPYDNSLPSERGLFFINHDGSSKNKSQEIWTQGQVGFNSRWFPTIDNPNEKSSQEIYLTVNEKFKTLSNGSLVSSQVSGDGTRTDYWKMNQQHSTYLFMVSVNQKSVVQGNWNGLPLSYWIDSTYHNEGAKIFGNTPEMLTYFSNVLNYNYPWPKYDQIIVEDFTVGGMENTSVSVFIDDMLVSSSEVEDQSWDDLISHELFHQWFGDLVSIESWANITLNEAFASYGEYLWLDYKYGEDSSSMHAYNELQEYLDEAKDESKELIRTYYDDPNELFDNHTYAKGAGVIHMLRMYIGDEAFFESLNKYLTTYAYKTVEIHDLRMVFEDVTGEDLNWFFDQWFFSSGHPKLEVNHWHSKDTLYINIKQNQDLTIAPLFRLPLHLDLFINDEIIRYPIIVQDQEHLFRIALSKKPGAIIIDGDYQLVGEITHQKTEEELLTQLKSEHSLMARYEAIEKLLSMNEINENIKSAIKLGLSDKSDYIKELSISYLSQYEKSIFTDHIDQIKLLTQSTNSYVRSSALEVLSENNIKINWEEYLDDPSYIVKGLALNKLLAKNDTILNNELFKKYKDEININVVSPLSYYVNTDNISDGLNWYLDKIETVRTSDLIYVINALNDFIVNMNNEDQKIIIEEYSLLALNHHDYIVRFTAFMGLQKLERDSFLKARLQEIMKQERHPVLKEIYLNY